MKIWCVLVLRIVSFFVGVWVERDRILAQLGIKTGPQYGFLIMGEGVDY